jgi:hypothetical protein
MDGFFPTLISKNQDQNAADNVLFVQLSDGSAVLTSTGGALDVNIDNASIVVTATDLDIRDLDHTTDSVALGDGTDLLAINNDGSINITDNGGSITIDGTITIQDGGNSITIDDGGSSITVDGTVTVTATDLDIRDLSDATDSVSIGDGTDTLAVNTDGSINVNIINSVISGEVHAYDTTSSVNHNSSDNHDYTVTGTTFLLQSVIVSASGRIKVEVQTGPLASLTTKAVIFLNGFSGDTKQIDFNPPIEVPVTSTGTVRLIRTNQAGAATDVYSTIIGREL